MAVHGGIIPGSQKMNKIQMSINGSIDSGICVQQNIIQL